MPEKTDLNLLRLLTELYEQRNVGQVAKTLHQSQSATSMALKKLRVMFNDPLFVKTHEGMTPTMRASQIIDPIRESLRQIDDAITADGVFDPRTATNRFTFALSEIGEHLFLPGLAAQIGVLAPNTTIQVVAPTLAGIEHGLERGDIQIVLGYRPDLKRTTYFQQKIFSSRHVCVMRSDHPLKGDRINAAQFLQLRHALICANNRAHEELEQFLERRRMKRDIYVKTPHILTIPSLIIQSDMIATLPQFFARHMAALYPNIKVVIPEFNLPLVDVKQYWHRRFHSDPANRWLRHLIAKTFQNSCE